MSSLTWNINADDVRRIVHPSFTTENGSRLRNCEVAFSTWGELNDTGSNCIVVCHALTGNTDAADWWGHLIGPGRLLDTSDHFVICLNVPGSPYGSVSPLTLNPATGHRYGASFPRFTVRDTVALHRLTLEALGIKRVNLVIGGSLGGMQAAEWAFQPDYVERVVTVACGPNHSPWCIGWSTAQRLAIQGDPEWKAGEYEIDEQPVQGLSLARQVAMMTYRAFGEFDSRFGRETTDDGQHFAVQSYLEHHGRKLVARFDANCYVALTHLMDSHDIRRGRSGTERVAPTLVVAIDSDVLYPPEEQKQLATLLPESQYEEVQSIYGHDGFLIEQEQLSTIIQRWLNDFRSNQNSTTHTTSAKHAACGV